jgi:uncharacterized lipoprotein YddW (UPF0748 family)
MRLMFDENNHYRGGTRASSPFWYYTACGEDTQARDNLRGAWITTVWNIDWPSANARGTTPRHVDMQKAELRELFTDLANTGVNAAIFQVSGNADAIWPSNFVPWAHALTGQHGFLGELRDSGGELWDPLAYAIQLSREFNMEFHAWFNPYRVGSSVSASAMYAGHIRATLTTPEAVERWPRNPFHIFGDELLRGDSVYFVNPGTPEAREWIVERIMEVALNYDVDVIHFDDYFYWAFGNNPDTRETTFVQYNSPEYNTFSNATFPDSLAGYHAWRREQTTMMVRDVSEALRAQTPWIRFGISPAGVWRRGDGSTADPNWGIELYPERPVGPPGWGLGPGSPSGGYFNYENNFADTRLWAQLNLIDYLAPQLYWNWNHTSAYGIIADWWGRLFRDIGQGGNAARASAYNPWGHSHAQLYIGMSPYAIRTQVRGYGENDESTQFQASHDFLRQENYNVGNPMINGSIFFTARDFMPSWHNITLDNNQHHMIRSLRGLITEDEAEYIPGSGSWKYPALVPPIPGMGAIAPHNPINITRSGNTVTWQNGERSTLPLITPRYFVLYGVQGCTVDSTNPANILGIVQANNQNDTYHFEIPAHRSDVETIIITAANRFHHQSVPGHTPPAATTLPVFSEITADITGQTVSFTGTVSQPANGIREIYATLTVGTTVIDISNRIMRRGPEEAIRYSVDFTLVHTFTQAQIDAGSPVTLTLRAYENADTHVYASASYTFTID